jgi:hypothetical protein
VDLSWRRSQLSLSEAVVVVLVVVGAVRRKDLKEGWQVLRRVEQHVSPVEMGVESF